MNGISQSPLTDHSFGSGSGLSFENANLNSLFGFQNKLIDNFYVGFECGSIIFIENFEEHCSQTGATAPMWLCLGRLCVLGSLSLGGTDSNMTHWMDGT